MVSTEAAMCAEPTEGLKIWGKSSNVEGINGSPLVGIGLTDLQEVIWPP